jgi:TolB-like protein/Tfp pilus assembly protein PilF
VATVVEYGAQVLDALAHAHGRGVIHRDLKSANLMVKADGQIKLLDFGLARQVGPTDLASYGTAPAPVEMTAAAGTLPYMAPEVLQGQAPDARTDIWAFGVLLYEMATGHLPFAGRTAEALKEAILADTPADLPATVPSALALCILDCLQKDPAQRPQDVVALRARFDTLSADRELPERAPVGPPDGVPSRSQASGPGSRARRSLSIAVVGLAALAALIVFDWASHQLAGSNPPAIRALAVLPLENLAGDPAQDYFADGITEALISDLSRTRGLRVVSRTTAMGYRGPRKSRPEVARQLKVDALIEGSVMREGNRVRVAATLFRAGGRQMWTGTYERAAGEILALRRDLVRRIALEIHAPLAVEDDMSAARAVEPRVYESYLKGRYYWNKRTPASLATAVDQFLAATRDDPTFAPAYVGLADCYNQLGTVMVGSGSPVQMRPLAVSAAVAALQIDPMLGDAHAALAYTRHYDWQWDAADREFQRALQLVPNNALVHVWYANYLMSLRRMDEAVAEVQKARELDPLSLVVITNVGWTLQFAGRPAEAVKAFQDALALDPGYIQAHSRLAGTYGDLSRFDASIGEHETVRRLTDGGLPSLIGLTGAYARAGRRRQAEELLRQVLDAADRQYVSPYGMAQPYAHLGDFEHAFTWLERAYDERSNGMAYLAVDPIWRPVRSDARYQGLLQRIGLRR